LDHLRTALETEPQPTAAFQRVTQSAGMQAWERQRAATTGADLLAALFAEWKSPAVQMLTQQHLTQKAALSFIDRR
jgi:ATP-dependent Clp protease ATP-binding subunit ClpA